MDICFTFISTLTVAVSPGPIDVLLNVFFTSKYVVLLFDIVDTERFAVKSALEFFIVKIAYSVSPLYSRFDTLQVAFVPLIDAFTFVEFETLSTLENLYICQ